MKDIQRELNKIMMEINRYCTIEDDREGETEGGTAWRKTRYFDPYSGTVYNVEMLNGKVTMIQAE